MLSILHEQKKVENGQLLLGELLAVVVFQDRNLIMEIRCVLLFIREVLSRPGEEQEIIKVQEFSYFLNVLSVWQLDILSAVNQFIQNGSQARSRSTHLFKRFIQHFPQNLKAGTFEWREL